MTAQGVLVNGSIGPLLVCPPSLSGSGSPSASLKGILGQSYFDTSTNPRTGYVWDGSTWLTDSGSGSFSTLTVTGQSTLANTSIVGTTTINSSGSASTTIGTGGTGSVSIGNATGNTAITGNMTWASALQGPVLTGVTASGASPQTANARAFSVTFTGVSIAAAATQSFTIQNSLITAASTIVQYTMIGATTGAALNIQSVTNSSGQSVIVVENGTGATTTTANITFVGHVLN